MAYHINPDTGRANKCSASVRSCKYAKAGELPPHYETKIEAQNGYEESMTENTVEPVTSKKPMVEYFENFKKDSIKDIHDIITLPLGVNHGEIIADLDNAAHGKVVKGQREEVTPYGMRTYLAKAHHKLKRGGNPQIRKKIERIITRLDNSAELLSHGKFLSEKQMRNVKLPEGAEFRVDRLTKQTYVELYNGVAIYEASEKYPNGGVYFEVRNLENKTIDANEEILALIRKHDS